MFILFKIPSGGNGRNKLYKATELNARLVCEMLLDILDLCTEHHIFQFLK